MLAKNPLPKIIVIGGGLAGLTAAYRLAQNGQNVHLYEARSRMGGRVLSAKTGENIIELGGHNLADGGGAPVLRRLIGECELKIVNTPTNLRPLYFDGSTVFSPKQLAQNARLDQDQLNQRLKKLKACCHNMKQVLTGLFAENDPLYKMLATRLTGYEGFPLEHLSTFYVDTLLRMMTNSLSSTSSQQKEFAQVEGGNALLAEKMATALGDRAHVRMAVTKVAKTRKGSFHLSFANGKYAGADILILAIPCSVYKNLFFHENVLAKDHLAAIKKIRYGKHAKVFLPVPSHFSDKVGLMITDFGVSFLNSPNLLTLYFINSPGGLDRNLLWKSYIQFKSFFEKVHKKAFPPFQIPTCAEDRHFCKYRGPVTYHWATDVYAQGSYSYLSSNKQELFTKTTEKFGEVFRSLFAPIDKRLYFAGEHTSICMETIGTMEAACESGQRVARAIIRHIRSSATGHPCFSKANSGLFFS